MRAITMRKTARAAVVAAGAAALAVGVLTSRSGAQTASPAPAAPQSQDERMAWWREARFGMFIHWGLYAIPAGEWKGKPISGTGEWIMRNAQAPSSEYETLAARFNPVRFDADEWVRIARRAGMRYIVITTKHHDGFCLFDSKLTGYTAAKSPFGRDVMRELSDACHRDGMRVGWYHSILDWHHPDYMPRHTWDPRPGQPGPDFDRYCGHLKGQLAELLTNYGRVDVMWFDGEWEDTWTHERGVELFNHCRALQPRVIINNRVDKGRNDMAGLNKAGEWVGDYGTPEQEVPSRGIPGMDWETCMTMNGTWGFRADDHGWKSSQELIRTLVDVASKGGNFLLNVGPDALGQIPAESVQRLEDVGRWMSVNGDAIYGTSASPFRRLPWGRATVKRDRLYLHVFDWPESGELVVPGLMTEVRRASVPAKPGVVLVTERRGEDVVVRVGKESPDAAAAVVALDLAGTIDVVEPVIRAGAGGVLVLTAEDADLHGPSLRLEGERRGRNIGYWGSREALVSWDVEAAAGKYGVRIELACKPESAGGKYAVEVKGSRVEGVVPATGGWQDFKMVDVGEVSVSESGRQQVTIRALGDIKDGLMNIRRVELTPRK